MNSFRLLLTAICFSAIFSGVNNPPARAQSDSLYREAMVTRCRKLANENHLDLERRSQSALGEANYYVVYLPQGRNCLLFSNYQQPRRFSTTNTRFQRIQIEIFTNDGSYLRVYSRWSETWFQYGASNPNVTQTWHAVVADVDVFRNAGSGEPVLRFGAHKLEVSLTPSGMITEYQVGSSQVADQYLPEIRAALEQINRYRLPLDSRPF